MKPPETMDGMMRSGAASALDGRLAIVGFAGRFPKAATSEEFWQVLRDGVECISFFTEEELLAAGVPADAISDPGYVKAWGKLDGADLFDAEFFDIPPREAEMLDPQHRLFLECAWEAFEKAGYVPGDYDGAVGVFAGSSPSEHVQLLQGRADLNDPLTAFHLYLANQPDALTTRVSYKLNLRGPSVGVQTACSTSLVAFHMACQSVLNGESDMALAGGVSVVTTKPRGYLYSKGAIFSPDGHCRAFDARAEGTVGGSGAGVVLIKRLADALRDRDRIHAIVLGSAVNNDGSLKVGYTAPSIQGQARVIAEALEVAGVDPATLTYIEAHGTGTSLGDPIEVAALTQVFRASTDAVGFCALGSLKSNMGHLDAAAGVGGLIKAILALRHQMIPPSLHFERPNPNIDFTGSPFYVPRSAIAWRTNGTARRVGVSSFGIGGTNAHVVLEEPPPPEPHRESKLWHLLVVSARSDPALQASRTQLAQHLEANPRANLADVAFTLQVGRVPFTHRAAIVAQNVGGAVAGLRELNEESVCSRITVEQPSVVFVLPGQGVNWGSSARELYTTDLSFKSALDQCCRLLGQPLGGRLIESLTVMGPPNGTFPMSPDQGDLGQLRLFIVEYALAQTWRAWGIQPAALIGHSLGEYVAACLAGVFSLEGALQLVRERGRLMTRLPPGGMMAVALSEAKLQVRIPQDLSLAAINAPNRCVVSGAPESIDRFERELVAEGVVTQRLQVSHAFHSAMVEPILESFRVEVQRAEPTSPRVPYISNVTGTWVDPAVVRDPDYWLQHLRNTVRFGDGIVELSRDSSRLFLELGPGHLSGLVRQGTRPRSFVLRSSILPGDEAGSNNCRMLETLGHLWCAGVPVDWGRAQRGEQPRRVELPTYPFERKSFALPSLPASETTGHAPSGSKRSSDIAEWFYLPSWRRSVPPASVPDPTPSRASPWVVFIQPEAGAEIIHRLRDGGARVIVIEAGESFRQTSRDAYTINPRSAGDYDSLVGAMLTEGAQPDRVLQAWNLGMWQDQGSDHDRFEARQFEGFYSLTFLTSALAKQLVTSTVRLWVASTGLHDVTGVEPLCESRAPLLGACKVIAQEYPNVVCRNVDVIMSGADGSGVQEWVDPLMRELAGESVDPIVAYRGGHRWVQTYEPLRLEGTSPPRRVRSAGAYWIIGGFSRLGLHVAENLAWKHGARLMLTGRTQLPPRESWSTWIRSKGERDPVSIRLRAIERLEALGAEVLAPAADAADPEAMRTAFDLARRRWGALHGVIYAPVYAGDSAEAPISAITPTQAARQFRTKALGVYVLRDILQGERHDWCVLFSSLASVLGGLQFASYSGANCFLDHFACQQSRSGGTPWISLNWEGWQDSRGESASHQDSLTGPLISPAEGVEAFARAVSLEGVSQLVVCPQDLPERLRRWVRAEAGAAPRAAGPPIHPRPRMVQAYAPPEGELERKVAQVWENLLGITPVGRLDNFLELGGDSLLGTQVLSHLRRHFQVDLSVDVLLRSPTVAELAQAVEDVLILEIEKIGQEEEIHLAQ
jgi:acyl transferase domain-containing protein